jgi:beta-glucosidase
MRELGLKCYRFSISWSRILPQGRGPVNEAGVAFYNKLIDALLANNIEPWVTLYHWDLPLALQMEMDGLLNPEIAGVFANYGRVCFERFGDRVKHWITLNEPWCSAFLGHGNGYFAPGRVSTSEPYRVAHNLLRAHAYAVDVYRREFQPNQGGMIGITNNCDWREPASDSPEDRAAAQRALEFFLGWFADPVYLGDYPASMRERVGDRLPEFTKEDRQLLHGSSDFFGLNHYTTMLAAEPRERLTGTGEIRGNGGLSEDQQVTLSDDPSWLKTDMDWNIVPWGCRKMLEWIDARYAHPPIYITENGCALPGEGDREVALNDVTRRDFLKGYLEACHEAISNGVDLRGYMAWSLLDNFEWALGYTRRFGLFWVDYTNGERVAKSSAKWYASVCKGNAIDP